MDWGFPVGATVSVAVVNAVTSAGSKENLLQQLEGLVDLLKPDVVQLYGWANKIGS